MRSVPLVIIITVLALVAATLPLEAQSYRDKNGDEWVRLRIVVPKRSFLDPGKSVKPGSMRYLNYTGDYERHFPNYGPPYQWPYSRLPMPIPYELPGYP
jgi:hypothetical protein